MVTSGDHSPLESNAAYSSGDPGLIRDSMRPVHLSVTTVHVPPHCTTAFEGRRSLSPSVYREWGQVSAEPGWKRVPDIPLPIDTGFRKTAMPTSLASMRWTDALEVDEANSALEILLGFWSSESHAAFGFGAERAATNNNRWRGGWSMARSVKTERRVSTKTSGDIDR
jgi:hypothetical protein